jgi:UDP-N-acetylmuramoylalanine--D-glutamate ligase
MSSFKQFVSGKRITVMGLGLLGRGVGDAAFLAQCGARVLVTDKKTEEQLAESVAQLKKYPNITFHLGGHDEKDFTDTDMVLKAAGVPLDSPYIAAARAEGVPIFMSTALAAKYAREQGAIIIGITGTRGKSTVTQMIFEVLRKYNDNVLQAPRVFLGGNVRGVSTLALLPEIKQDDTLVLELDSWQLQGFGDLHISPDVAVFPNFMTDHQNYYKTMEEYFLDKANIFRHQKEGDALIVCNCVLKEVQAAHPPVSPVTPQPWPGRRRRSPRRRRG